MGTNTVLKIESFALFDNFRFNRKAQSSHLTALALPIRVCLSLIQYFQKPKKFWHYLVPVTATESIRSKCQKSSLITVYVPTAVFLEKKHSGTVMQSCKLTEKYRNISPIPVRIGKRLKPKPGRKKPERKLSRALTRSSLEREV